MKKILFILTIITSAQTLKAQTVPLQFSYKAVLRDNANQPLVSKNINIRFSILQGGSTGDSIFLETHNTTTTDLGIVTLNIGSKRLLKRGELNKPPYFLKVELDPDAGTNFETVGVAPLLSVPFSFVSDSTLHQIIQKLSIVGDSLVLSNGGGGVKFPSGLTPQKLSYDDANKTLSLSPNGNSIQLPNNNPKKSLTLLGRTITLNPDSSSVTVPVQKMTLSQDVLTLSDGGGSVKLPQTPRLLTIQGRNITLYPDSSSVVVPVQKITLSNDILTLSDEGGSVKLPTSVQKRALTLEGRVLTLNPDSSSVTLPIQTTQVLGISTDTITLSNGGGFVKLPASTNTPRSLSITGQTLTLLPDNSKVLLPINLPQVLSLATDTIKLSNGGGFVKLPASTNTPRTISFNDTTRILTLNPDNSTVKIPNQVLSLKNDTLILSGGSGSVVKLPSGNTPRTLVLEGRVLSLTPDNSSVTLPLQTTQVLAITNDTITLSNGGGFVKLPTQTNTPRSLALTGRVLTLNPDNSSVNIPKQTIALSNDTILLSDNGGFVKLPAATNIPRALALNGRVLTLNPDNSSVTLPLQTIEILAISNDTLTLSNGGGFVKLPATNTAKTLTIAGRVLTLNPDKSNATIPSQTISLSNDTIRLSDNGGFVKLPKQQDTAHLSIKHDTLMLSISNDIVKLPSKKVFSSDSTVTVTSTDTTVNLQVAKTNATSLSSNNNTVTLLKTGSNYDLAVPATTYSTPDTTVSISKLGNNVSLSAKTTLLSSNNSVSIVRKPTLASSNIFDLTVTPTAATTLTSNNQTVTLTKTANNYDLAVNFANYSTTITSADKSIIVIKTGNNYDLKSNVTATLKLPYLDSTKSQADAFSIISSNSSAIVGTTNYYSQNESAPTKYGVLGIATTYTGIGVSGQNKSGTGMEASGTYGLRATGTSIGLTVDNSVNYSYVSLCTASNSGYFYGLPVYIASTDLTVDGTIQATGNRIILESGGSGTSAYGYFTVRNATPHELFTATTVAGLSNNGYAFIRDQNGANIRAGMYLNGNNQGIVFGDVKSFKMQHPKYPDKDIVYACVEGPEVAAYSRGTAQLVNGEAIIKFTEHFIEVINPETATFILTPRSIETYGLAVVESSATGFTVKELRGNKGSFKFDWEVKAVRKGYEKFEPVQDKVLPSQPTVYDNTFKNKNESIKRN